jgi:rhamnosyl/mannosyltransferase
VVVPPDDSEALHDALASLLADSELRRRLGEAGRERARTEFSVERMARRTLAVYKEVS